MVDGMPGAERNFSRLLFTVPAAEAYTPRNPSGVGMVNAGKLVGKILAGFKRSAMLPMLGVVTPNMLLT